MKQRLGEFGPKDLDQARQDDIVQRYEAGEAVRSIVSCLRELGLPATIKWVEYVLDRHSIIRHPKAKDIPKGAPEGFSVTSAARIRNEVISGEGNETARTVRRDDLSYVRQGRRVVATIETYRNFGREEI